MRLGKSSKLFCPSCRDREYNIGIDISMKTKPPKKDGFYMNINEDDRRLLDELKDKHAINIAQAFKLFLRDMLGRLQK